MVEVLYYAIPFFVLLLAVEALSFRHYHEDDLVGYELRDTRTSISMGLGNVIVNVAWKLVVLVVYAWRGRPEMSTLALRRSRSPIRGSDGSSSSDAKWRAGQTNARRERDTVIRSAWSIRPGRASSGRIGRRSIRSLVVSRRGRAGSRRARRRSGRRAASPGSDSATERSRRGR
jgi:hypothetical protein